MEQLIDFDYKLKQKEADGKIYEYIPNDNFRIIDNIAFIEGPNSSGKSTLLNILAVSLWGQKRTDIHPSLIGKMNDLMNTDHNKLLFNIKIKGKNNSIEIVSEKTNSDVNSFKVYEIINGSKNILTPESFERKYNLIYDIPANPIQRLVDLTKEIEIEQEKITGKIDRFSSFLENVIQNVKNSQKTDEIGTIKELIKLKESENNQSILELNEKKKVAELLELYLFAKYYQEYYIINDTLNFQLEKMKNRLNLLKKKENVVQGKDAQIKTELINGIKQITDKIKIVNNFIPTLLKDDKNHVKVWSRTVEKLTPEIILNDCQFPESFDREITYLLKKCDSLQGDNEKNKIIKEANLYQKIITLLKEYESSDITIPGIDINIKTFIKNLEKEYQKNDSILKIHKNIGDTKSHLTDISIIKKRMDTKLEKLKEGNKNQELLDSLNQDYDIVNNMYKEKTLELEEANGKLEGYKQQCIQKGINKNALTPNDKLEFLQLSKIVENITDDPKFSNYKSFLEEQLSEEVQNVNRAIRDLNSQIIKNQQFIEIKKQDLRQLEDIKPHKYQNDLRILDELFDASLNLKSKFEQDYSRYINIAISKNALSYSENDNDMKKYFNEVFKYLGNRVGYILHENEYLKVKEINLLKEVIITDKRTVRFMNMGTGQNQAAYLLGKLSTNDKNKKIIALFDEVAMMDDKSLEVIFNKFNELYKNDQLLLGIVVQKGLSTKVVSKLCE